MKSPERLTIVTDTVLHSECVFPVFVELCNAFLLQLKCENSTCTYGPVDFSYSFVSFQSTDGWLREEDNSIPKFTST